MRPVATCFGLLLAVLAAVGAAQAQPVAEFQAFIETEIWPEARGEGVSRATFEAALSGLSPRMDLPDLIRPGAPEVEQRNFQAEFRNGADYLAERAVAGDAAEGRRLLARYAGVLSRIEAQYGVPAPILIAIWGRESAFGQASIPHDAFEVLATKAWASRRAEMFRAELISALRIVEQGHRTARQMRSSWAGALGQPQFMPTSFLKYAVDFDGDGRKDIWDSVPDTLASIANYLKARGWQAGRDWGFESRVPQEVSCTLEGPDREQTIAAFAAAGVARVSGRPFPDHELRGVGHLLMPAGRLGPAFIATPNFYVIKEYNNSDLYALFVGHVADRIRGAGPLVGDWRSGDPLTRGDVARLQEKLEARGHDVGGVDGLAGFKTRRSIGIVERELGLAETCWPSLALIRALG